MRLRPGQRRTAAVFAAAAVVTVTLPGPVAHAASLGTLTVTPASGSVDINPMFATATASSTCPATYGTNAGLRIGRAGAPQSQSVSLMRVADDGNYDTVPPSLSPNRSMRTAFGATPVTDGGYTLIVVCTGESAGDHPDTFSVGITVSGATWTVTGGGGPTTNPTANPTDGRGTKVTLNTEVGPAATSASPSPTGTPGGGLPRTGSAVARTAAAGLGLVAAGVLIVRLVRRRRLA